MTEPSGSAGPRPPTMRLDASVRGRVQGVGYRAFVLGRASRLGLTGWVANLADGRVRCVAEGPREGLERLLAALRLGPPAGRVDSVTETWTEATGEWTDFSARPGWHGGD